MKLSAALLVVMATILATANAGSYRPSKNLPPGKKCEDVTDPAECHDYIDCDYVEGMWHVSLSWFHRIDLCSYL